MTRKNWVQDPHTLKLIPKDEYRPRSDAGFFVMGDIQPYKSMVTGEMIMGRRQHREHLRQHGVIEVGNEKLTPSAPKTPSRDEYRRAVSEVMAGKGF